MLILRIFVLLLMAINITAYAAVLGTLARIGIVRMSGIANLVSLVSSCSRLLKMPSEKTMA